VCGPTATGKSRLAVDIARKFGGEVINADSMQIYRGMDIANAMPTESEMMGVKHHLFGIIEPYETFSVADWLVLAREKIAELAERSVLPVIVGGTGLYISSLVENIIFDDVGEDPDFRAEMYNLAEAHGNSYLLEQLRKVDPEAASRLHENNVKRVIRALETFKYSSIRSEERLNQSRTACSPYEVCMLGIDFEDRKMLYDRINSRVDMMISKGLVDEARIAFERRQARSTSAQAIGHKELFPAFEGTEGLESCIENLKMKTRNYSKRQMTWFRKNVYIKWLFMNENSRYVHVFEKTVAVLNDFVK
jgi:tRNA dimethylallyltransferase